VGTVANTSDQVLVVGKRISWCGIDIDLAAIARMIGAKQGSKVMAMAAFRSLEAPFIDH
jgi:hypothetical protein